MQLIKIIYTSLGSIFVLFILTKLMGNREMSQLSVFDYINSITIGSIAAEMATALEDDFKEPLIAMIIYALVIIVISIISNKSLKFRMFVSGRSKILIDKGNLFYDNFKKSKIDLNEFLIQCRTQGYFNIADIETALLEPNGKISILPKETKRPATCEDLKLEVLQTRPVFNVILDGKILDNNLKATGNDKKWLEKKLKEQKQNNINNIFLATCDENNNLCLYVKNNMQTKHDIFE